MCDSEKVDGTIPRMEDGCDFEKVANRLQIYETGQVSSILCPTDQLTDKEDVVKYCRNSQSCTTTVDMGSGGGGSDVKRECNEISGRSISFCSSGYSSSPPGVSSSYGSYYSPSTINVNSPLMSGDSSDLSPSDSEPEYPLSSSSSECPFKNIYGQCIYGGGGGGSECSAKMFEHMNLEELGEYHYIRKLTRYSNGSIKLRNPHIKFMDQDILYHLALGSESHDLVEMFSDVKFVCIGGTPKRMEEFAYYIMSEIGHKIPTGTQLLDISQHSYRYSMYKTGPVLSISHGMGIPSVSILLHEIIKLMYHSRAKDPVFFRIGTCGGIGIEGGNVIITEEALNADLKPYHEVTVLGRKLRRNAKLDKRLSDELMTMAQSMDEPYSTHIGKTMCTDDFYEGQGRLDGAFCEYTEKEKMSYIQQLHRSGVTNIEMESLAFAALTHHAGIRAAVVCVSIVDRMVGDQVLAQKEVLNEWQIRPQKLIARYIKKHLGLLQEDQILPMCDLNPPCPCPHKIVLRVKSPRRMNMVQQESQSYD